MYIHIWMHDCASHEEAQTLEALKVLCQRILGNNQINDSIL